MLRKIVKTEKLFVTNEGISELASSLVFLEIKEISKVYKRNRRIWDLIHGFVHPYVDMSARALCIECVRPVRRSVGITCDLCNRLQHRACNTGMYIFFSL